MSLGSVPWRADASHIRRNGVGRAGEVVRFFLHLREIDAVGRKSLRLIGVFVVLALRRSGEAMARRDLRNRQRDEGSEQGNREQG